MIETTARPRAPQPRHLGPALVAKDTKIGARCTNATVATKPAFGDAFRRVQRCLVPADFFYEW